MSKIERKGKEKREIIGERERERYAMRGIWKKKYKRERERKWEK